ncbi:MAG TPA: DUF6323 family protein [Anaerovoracaceae bacterium]|nr:DUF6323 family protein [Anaerovoracaceae bacterium]
MNEQFSLIPNAAAQQFAVTEIISCNQATSRYGLILKESEAAELANTRSEALEKVGRIEFSGGVINKLITEFCDSPYLNQSNYAETLNELVETFYYFKNETLDEFDDDELIAMMKKSFNHSCRGSVDLMQTRDLEILARGVRFGIGDQESFNEDPEGIFEEDAGGTVSMDDLILPEDFDDFEVGTLQSYTDLYRYYRKGYEDESY